MSARDRILAAVDRAIAIPLVRETRSAGMALRAY